MNGTSPSQTSNVSDQFVTEKLPVGWPWRLLVFAVVIFALTLFIYFGIRFGYTAYLDGRSSELDRSLDALTNEVSVADQERFVGFYSQVANLKAVIEKHPFSANLFAFLEQNVIGGVTFGEARFKAVDRVLTLQGAATNFDVLSQQMGVFEKVREVEKVLLEDVSVSGGGVTFKLSVFFTETFFKKQIAP